MERIPTFLPVVAVALVGEDGRWLMQQRPSGKHHAGLWEFPGGKLESGETPREALVREAHEELGILLDPVQLMPAAMADNASDQAGNPIVILLYTCRDWSGVPRAIDGAKLGWFTGEEAKALPKPPLDHELVRQLCRDE